VAGPQRYIEEQHVYEDIMPLVDWIREDAPSMRATSSRSLRWPLVLPRPARRRSLQQHSALSRG
jgi:hypothetical protein